jgi:hypothetical protein
LTVTSFIGIVSRARAHILRLTHTGIHHLVALDWAARAVLRFRRLRDRLAGTFERTRRAAVRPSLNLVERVLVLSLGFVLVVPVISGRAATTHAVAEYSGYVLWTSPVRSRNAPEMAEILKAPAVEDRPAPAVMPQPDPSATVVRARTAPPVFTPPPGSGGDGLAAIYAVFGNSPGLTWALRVANCESHYNPLSVNRSSGASGLFQFMPSTWNANFPGQNIWDPYAQARGALTFYNAGRQSAWTCK